MKSIYGYRHCKHCTSRLHIVKVEKVSDTELKWIEGRGDDKDYNTVKKESYLKLYSELIEKEDGYLHYHAESDSVLFVIDKENEKSKNFERLFKAEYNNNKIIVWEFCFDNKEYDNSTYTIRKNFEKEIYYDSGSGNKDEKDSLYKNVKIFSCKHFNEETLFILEKNK